MSMIRFVTPDGLPAFLAYLSQNGRRVLVPVEKPANKRSVVFEPWQEGKPFTLEKATVPAKEAVLPQCETLVRYKKTKDPENLERVTMSLDDKPEAQPTVVFACRPCDARGYAVLDRPYLKGPYADPYYKARRDQLTVVTLTCGSGCNTCFCHWVGGGPTSPEGSDVLMTEIEGGYVLQGITPKGPNFSPRRKPPARKPGPALCQHPISKTRPKKWLPALTIRSSGRIRPTAASPAGPAPTFAPPATASPSPMRAKD